MCACLHACRSTSSSTPPPTPLTRCVRPPFSPLAFSLSAPDIPFTPVPSSATHPAPFLLFLPSPLPFRPSLLCSSCPSCLHLPPSVAHIGCLLLCTTAPLTCPTPECCCASIDAFASIIANHRPTAPHLFLFLHAARFFETCLHAVIVKRLFAVLCSLRGGPCCCHWQVGHELGGGRCVNHCLD